MNLPRILIVDDEPSFIRLLKLVLEHTGRYVVREENEPTHALDAARQFHPDLVLLDLVMPKWDGIDVARALRAETQFSHLPIIFLSATVIEQGGIPSTLGGFPAYAKPMTVTNLMKAIDFHLVGASTSHPLPGQPESPPFSRDLSQFQNRFL